MNRIDRIFLGMPEARQEGFNPAFTLREQSISLPAGIRHAGRRK